MKAPFAQVLAVEDNADLANLMRRVLQPAGVELTVSTSGELALELLRKHRFDLVILNFRLPGINGLEVCRRLKLDPDLCAIPVVFASGETNGEIVERAMHLGAVDYLIKPFGIEEFRERVLVQLHRL